MVSKSIPDFCHSRLDDKFLIRYLRVAKYDVAKALDKIEKFFKLQQDWPEVFGNCKWSRAKPIIEAGIIQLMETDKVGWFKTIFFLIY